MRNRRITKVRGNPGQSGDPDAGIRRVTGKLREVIWQDWCTRCGVTMTDYYYIQPATSWFQTDDRTEADIVLDLLSIGAPLSLTAVTGLTFSLQTALVEQGPWAPLASFTAATIALLRLSSDPNSPYPMGRFLRVVIESVAPWQATYRLSAFVSPDSGPLNFNESDNEHAGEWLAPWTSYRGSIATGGTGLVAVTGVQNADEYLGTDELQYLVLEPEITMLSGATLLIESSFGEDGPWRTVAAYTTAYTAAQVIMAEMPADASVKVLGRKVRTRVVAPAGHWIACYRVNAKWS